MKTTQKHQTFLATSSKKYFKVGLAGAILFSIAVFELPIYAGTPNYVMSEPQEDPNIIYISEIVPIKNIVLENKKVAPIIKSPVVKLIITNDPTPEPDPEPAKPVLKEVPANITQVLLTTTPPKKNKEWNFVEVMPEFNGGLKELYKFFSKNIEYSKIALKLGLEGKVHVRFVIDQEGNIKHVEIAKGVHPLLDNEAIRVVKSMPKWSPGIQNGENVSVVMVLPINFLMQ
jgi:TonB family protein